MYGAWLFPKISPRLWFSMTMVNTVPPCQPDGATAEAWVSGSHAALVLPELFAQPKAGATMTTSSALREVMTANLVLDVTIDLREFRVGKSSTQRRVRALPIDIDHSFCVARVVADQHR